MTGVQTCALPIAVSDNSSVILSEVWHLHKGKCDTEFTAKLNKNGVKTAWHDLVDHFVHLVNNSGLPPVKLLDESKLITDLEFQ